MTLSELIDRTLGNRMLSSIKVYNDVEETEWHDHTDEDWKREVKTWEKVEDKYICATDYYVHLAGERTDGHLKKVKNLKKYLRSIDYFSTSKEE